jgi:hypothetical protein
MTRGRPPSVAAESPHFRRGDSHITTTGRSLCVCDGAMQPILASRLDRIGSLSMLGFRRERLCKRRFLREFALLMYGL